MWSELILSHFKKKTEYIIVLENIKFNYSFGEHDWKNKPKIK